MDSLISWVGGKKQLREKIASHIPPNINTYVEAFGGAGWLLFYKNRWAEVEVYNDKDRRLVNLFRIAKYHPEALKKEMEFNLHSREMFKDFRLQEGLTDVQRAARFFYLIKRSFGAKGMHFGTSAKSNSAKSNENILASIMNVAKRLDRVTIENLDYKDIFKIYDTEETFFFLDPPYRYGQQYEVGRMNYEEFLCNLTKLKGKFLLTIDDCKENVEMFKQFNIKKVSRANGINRKRIVNNRFKELFVMNY
ncbi:MAG: DNA adenine methylase [Ignavibacteriales bacterium]|nr:DNA adenine methylase [Ignavibacteriales bacterium]